MWSKGRRCCVGHDVISDRGCVLISNSFKKTQPLVLLPKIDDKMEQYASAVEVSAHIHTRSWWPSLQTLSGSNVLSFGHNWINVQSINICFCVFSWCRTPRMSGQWRHHWPTYPVHLKSSPPRKPCLKPERHGARILPRERAARWDHPLGPIFFFTV